MKSLAQLILTSIVVRAALLPYDISVAQDDALIPSDLERFFDAYAAHAASRAAA